MQIITKNKYMNILLWVFQILLAIWNVLGGIYVVGHYQDLAQAWALNVFPGPIWVIIGVLQILFSLGLILSKTLNKLSSISQFVWQ